MQHPMFYNMLRTIDSTGIELYQMILGRPVLVARIARFGNEQSSIDALWNYVDETYPNVYAAGTHCVSSAEFEQTFGHLRTKSFVGDRIHRELHLK